MVPAANRLDLNLPSVICRLCERREGLTGFCLTFLFRITVLTIASWTCFIWRTVGVHEMSASRLPSSRKGNRVDLIIYFSIRLSFPLPVQPFLAFAVYVCGRGGRKGEEGTALPSSPSRSAGRAGSACRVQPGAAGRSLHRSGRRSGPLSLLRLSTPLRNVMGSGGFLEEAAAEWRPRR